MEQHQGVVDRIEDERAVILVENLKENVILPIEKLPDDIKVGDRVDVSIENQEVIDIRLREFELDKKASLEDRLSKLKNTKSKFKKDS